MESTLWGVGSELFVKFSRSAGPGSIRDPPCRVLGGVLRYVRVLVRAEPGGVGAHVIIVSGRGQGQEADGRVTSADHLSLALGHSSTARM